MHAELLKRDLKAATKFGKKIIDKANKTGNNAEKIAASGDKAQTTTTTGKVAEKSGF